VLPKKHYFKLNVSNSEQYEHDHPFGDYNVVKNIIATDFPDYISDFEEFSNGKGVYCFNMLICNKKLFDNYCEWLFSILFKVEENIDFKNRSDYQQRVFGFLSERLLNIWVHHNNIKIKTYNVNYEW
ncbi:DUF4422 domain-containing protein, partial [Lactococcus hircilactis]